MKAIIFSEFGAVDVLKVSELPDPLPGPGEIRIRIRAAGVNPVDGKIRRGLLQQRIPHMFPVIPGWDASGEVDMLGGDISRFRIGDRVYAYCRKPVVQFGTYAQYVILPEQNAAAMPSSMSFEEAASVPLAGLTAWQSLFGAGELKNGETVLVHAAAGGVGGFAVQLAKSCGATVIATARAQNHAYVRSCGADQVIDYTQGDFREAVRQLCPGGVDLAFDTVGGSVQAASADIVRQGGILVSILAFTDEAALRARGVNTRYVFVSPSGEELNQLTRLIDGGRLRSRLSRVLPLTEARVAHELIESNHTVGKIVLAVD